MVEWVAKPEKEIHVELMVTDSLIKMIIGILDEEVNCKRDGEIKQMYCVGLNVLQIRMTRNNI